MRENYSCREAIRIALILVVAISGGNAQTFTVKGKVTTSTGPVRFASVTFVDRGDTTKRYSTITDTSGNYQLAIITSVKPHDNLPAKFELEQNYPNPFSSSTSISYKLTEQSNISVKIYNILGQLVKEIKAGSQDAGIHGVNWDGTNNFGKRVTPGVYFCQLKAGNKSQAKKMLFGFGGNTGTQLPLSSAELKGGAFTTQELSIEEKNFKVKIQETDSTQPRVLSEDFTGIVIGSDTTFDFYVETGKIVFAKVDTALRRPIIYKMDIDGSNLTQLVLASEILDTVQGIPRGRGMGTEPRWSPDGKKIVYSESLGPDESHIVMMNEDGTDKKVLTPVEEYCISPIWSPKGDHILYAAGSWGVIFATSILDTSGNSFDIHIAPESKVFDGDSVWYDMGSSQWQSDDDHLYVWGNVGSTQLIPVVGENPAGEIFSFEISTGRTIARLTHDSVDEESFEVSPDGSEFLLPQRTSISIFSFAAGLRLTIPIGQIGSLPHWSNVGRFIVVAKDADLTYSQNYEIWILDTFNSNEIQVPSIRGFDPDIFIDKK